MQIRIKSVMQVLFVLYLQLEEIKRLFPEIVVNDNKEEVGYRKAVFELKMRK